MINGSIYCLLPIQTQTLTQYKYICILYYAICGGFFCCLLCYDMEKKWVKKQQQQTELFFEWKPAVWINRFIWARSRLFATVAECGGWLITNSHEPTIIMTDVCGHCKAFVCVCLSGQWPNTTQTHPYRKWQPVAACAAPHTCNSIRNQRSTVSVCFRLASREHKCTNSNAAAQRWPIIHDALRPRHCNCKPSALPPQRMKQTTSYGDKICFNA